MAVLYALCHVVVLLIAWSCCSGFSSTACQVLNLLNTPYATVNVLDNPEIRAGIKVFSSWPTIPQLYVAGEFVGGTDIMVEMYNSGELAEMVELANAN